MFGSNLTFTTVTSRYISLIYNGAKGLSVVLNTTSTVIMIKKVILLWLKNSVSLAKPSCHYWTKISVNVCFFLPIFLIFVLSREISSGTDIGILSLKCISGLLIHFSLLSWDKLWWRHSYNFDSLPSKISVLHNNKIFMYNKHVKMSYVKKRLHSFIQSKITSLLQVWKVN